VCVGFDVTTTGSVLVLMEKACITVVEVGPVCTIDGTVIADLAEFTANPTCTGGVVLDPAAPPTTPLILPGPDATLDCAGAYLTADGNVIGTTGSGTVYVNDCTFAAGVVVGSGDIVITNSVFLGAGMRVSNLGSSGLDGVRITNTTFAGNDMRIDGRGDFLFTGLGYTGDSLVVSNIGSSGEDGVRFVAPALTITGGTFEVSTGGSVRLDGGGCGIDDDCDGVCGDGGVCGGSVFLVDSFFDIFTELAIVDVDLHLDGTSTVRVSETEMLSMSLSSNSPLILTTGGGVGHLNLTNSLVTGNGFRFGDDPDDLCVVVSGTEFVGHSHVYGGGHVTVLKSAMNAADTCVSGAPINPTGGIYKTATTPDPSNTGGSVAIATGDVGPHSGCTLDGNTRALEHAVTAVRKTNAVGNVDNGNSGELVVNYHPDEWTENLYIAWGVGAPGGDMQCNFKSAAVPGNGWDAAFGSVTSLAGPSPLLIPFNHEDQFLEYTCSIAFAPDLLSATLRGLIQSVGGGTTYWDTSKLIQSTGAPGVNQIAPGLCAIDHVTHIDWSGSGTAITDYDAIRLYNDAARTSLRDSWEFNVDNDRGTTLVPATAFPTSAPVVCPPVYCVIAPAIIDHTYAGLFMTGCGLQIVGAGSTAIVDDTTFVGVGTGAIDISAVTEAFVRNNVFINCGMTGDCVKVTLNAVSLEGLTMTNNTLTTTDPVTATFNTAAYRIYAMDNTLTTFDVSGNSAEGLPVGVRFEALVPLDESLLLNVLPIVALPETDDVQLAIRRLATNNNNAEGTFHDIIEGAEGTDGTIIAENFCDELCPNFIHEPENSTISGPVVGDFREVHRVYAPGAGQALTTTGIECMSLAVPACLDNRPCEYLDADLRDDFTFEFIAIPASVAGTQTLLDKGSFRIYTVGGNLRLDLVVAASTTTVISTAALAAGVSTHIAARRDGAAVTLVVDGATVGTATLAGQLDDHSATAAHVACTALTTEWYIGQIDELRLWTVARSNADIVANAGTTLSGKELGLSAYHRFDREGFEAELTSLDTTDHVIDGTLLGFAVPATAFQASNADFTNGLFRFARWFNHVQEESVTVGFFTYQDVRRPDTCSNRPATHAPFDYTPTVDWYDLMNPEVPAFVDPNQRYPDYGWAGRVTSAPLTFGTNFGAALPADYETATYLTIDLTLAELLGCRPDEMAPLLAQAAPVLETTEANGVLKYSGRNYLTAVEAQDDHDESAGEIIRRQSDFKYSVSIISDYGILVSFSTGIFDPRMEVISLIFDTTTGELHVTFGIWTKHIEQLYPGHESTQLRDLVVDPTGTGETGPPLTFVNANVPCTAPDREETYVDRFFRSALDPRWASLGTAPSLETSACVGDQKKWMRVGNDGQDTTLTLTGLPEHTHVEIILEVIAVGGEWDGDSKNEYFKLSVDGSGTALLTTLSTDVAEVHTFPNSVGGGSAAPSAADLGTLCSAGGTDGVFEFTSAALPHVTDTMVLRLRTIGVAGPHFAGIGNIHVVTYTSTGEYCYQEYEMITTGDGNTLDFRGIHPIRGTPYVFDAELGMSIPRGNDTYVEGSLVLDVVRSHGIDDSEDVEARQFETATPKLYYDMDLTNEQYGFVYKERVFGDLVLDLSNAEAGDWRVTMTEMNACTFEGGPPAPFDRENKETTGCNTPRAGGSIKKVYDADQSVAFQYKTEFDSNMLATPPAQPLSSALAYSFMSSPLISEGRTFYIELRYNVTSEAGHVFECVNDPRVPIPVETDITLHPDGSFTQDSTGCVLVVFIAGHATYTVAAALPDTSPYDGPVHLNANNEVITGLAGVSGSVLTLTDILPIVLPAQLSLNYALLFNTHPTSYLQIDYNTLPAVPLGETTVEFRLRLPSLPTTGTDLTLFEYYNVPNSASMGCKLLDTYMQCWRTLGGHDVRTRVAIPAATVNTMQHFAARVAVHGTEMHMTIFAGGVPVSHQMRDAAGASAPTSGWEWPLSLPVTLRAGAAGPDGARFDELRFWTAARSEDDIKANHDNLLPSPGTQPDLLSYHKVDDTATAFVNDAVAVYHGTLENTDSDPAKATTYVQETLPEGFYGYGLTTTVADVPLTFNGNYAAELKAGTAVSAAFTTLDDGTPDLTFEFDLNVPAGVLAYAAVTKILEVTDGPGDWRYEAYLSAAGVEMRRYSVGGVLNAATMIPEAAIPKVPADPHGIETRSQHFAFVFRQISTGPALSAFDAFLNGMPVGTAVQSSTTPTASVPAFPAATSFTMRLFGHAGSNTRMDEIRIWHYARTPLQLLQNWATTLVGTEAGLQHYWKFDNIAVPLTAADDAAAGSADLTLSGQAQKVEFNHRPEFTSYDFWGSNELLQFATARFYRTNFVDRRVYSRVFEGGAIVSRVAGAGPGASTTPSAGGNGLAVTVTCGPGWEQTAEGECAAAEHPVSNVGSLPDPNSDVHIPEDTSDDDEERGFGFWVGILVGGAILVVLLVVCGLLVYCMRRGHYGGGGGGGYAQVHHTYHGANVGAKGGRRGGSRSRSRSRSVSVHRNKRRQSDEEALVDAVLDSDHQSESGTSDEEFAGAQRSPARGVRQRATNSNIFSAIADFNEPDYYDEDVAMAVNALNE
jgi:hypothetical protein